MINPKILSALENAEPGSFVLDITPGVDGQGRHRFTAYWQDGFLPPSGVRGQCFHAELRQFHQNAQQQRRSVVEIF